MSPAATGQGVYTYEAASGRYRFSFKDSLGVSGAAESTGWQGRRQVWTGTLTTAKGTVPWRQTLEVSAPGRAQNAYEISSGGRWFVIGREVCTR